jgi:hypothetical protein
MDLAKQEADIYIFHSRTQVDLTEVAGATGTGLLLGAVLPHRGKRPDEHRAPYTFKFDQDSRPNRIQGIIVSHPSQKRNQAAQLAAGGKDRRKTDVGGHYVGRRFKGPLDDFNHFAQDGKFNNGKYKALENRWQTAVDRGQKVEFDIKVHYPAGSQRPSKLDIWYQIDDGEKRILHFVNEAIQS